MPVNTPSADHLLFKADRTLSQTLRGGTRSMREKGRDYLPIEPMETNQAYRNRVSRSVLTNFYRKTADKFTGKITRKAPALLEKTPQQIADIEDNIDQQGNSIAQFTEQALTWAVDDGVVFFFVDSPQAPASATGDNDPDAPPRTRAQDDAMGLRPYVRMITADKLLGWKHDVINGKPILLQIRILERITEDDPDDPWNETDIEQVRVVEPFVHKIYRLEKDDNGKEVWMLKETIETDFEEIPLVALYTNKERFLVGSPLFTDMANLNTAHWQSDSDQRNIVHVIRIPILFGTGLASAGEEVRLNIGANSLTVGEPGSDLKYVEHTGAAAEVGFRELERLEENLTRMGVEIILNKRTGNQTATARALDQAEIDSEMATISQNVEDAWKEAFEFLMIAFGLPTDNMDQIGINMNKDFSLGAMDIAALKELLAMRSTGDLSQLTLWEELQRHGWLSEDFDAESEIALLDDEKDANMEREAELLRQTEQIGADPFGENKNGSNSSSNSDDDDDDT